MNNIVFSTNDLPMYISVDQLAALLGISRAGAYTYVHTDGFPLIRIGKRMLVPRDKLLSWLDAQVEGAT